LQSFFSDPGGVGRDIALRSLRRDIVGLIGGPARIHDAVFIDAPLADFFVTERGRDLYAIRWLDSGDFASGLTRTLSAYVRLHETGKGEFARALGLPEDFSPATLVLVSDRVDDDWMRVVSTLRIPVMLLRAHSLVDGTRHSAGCLFEKCFAARAAEPKPSGGFQSAVGSREAAPVDASLDSNAPPSPTRDLVREPDVSPVPDLELQPDDRPVASRESSAARHLRQVSEVLEEEAAPEPEERAAEADPAPEAPAETVPPSSDSPAEREEILQTMPIPDEMTSRSEGEATESGAAESSTDRDGPLQYLSDEEIATFRLLENVLESTR